MKPSCFILKSHFLLSLSSCVFCAAGLSQASTILTHDAFEIIDLPTSVNLGVITQGNVINADGPTLLDRVKNYAFGAYAGGSGNNNIGANWGTAGEGNWVNADNVGAITLLGRSGVGGESFALVLAGPATGTSLSSVTFSCDTPITSVFTGNITLVLGICDASGNWIDSLTTSQSFAVSSTGSTPASVTFDFAEVPFEWQDGYKLVAGIRGGSGPATSPYTINNIQLSYTSPLVPEPSTATLGLVGLSALLLRRRRKSA